MSYLPAIRLEQTLRVSRSVFVMLVLAVYVFTGLSHGLCDLDISKFSGTTEISLMDDETSPTDKRVAADHHCHATFPAVTAQQIAAAPMQVMQQIAFIRRDLDIHGMARSLEPPPPKVLT